MSSDNGRACPIKLYPFGNRRTTYDIVLSGLSYVAIEPQSVQILSEDAIDLLNPLGVKEKVVFVGHNLAASVAAEIAATRADMVMIAVMMGPVLLPSK